MPPKFHVAHIITRLDMGGSAQNTLLTLLHLPTQGFELTLITGPPSSAGEGRQERAILDERFDSVRKQGVRIIELASLVRNISPRQDIRALRLLILLLRRLAPDGVHTHTSKAGLLGRVAAKIAGVPWVVHTAHGHVFSGHFGPALSRVFLWIEKLASAMTDHLIALTSGEASDYVRLGVMAQDRISVIPSGVPVERFGVEAGMRPAKRRELGLADENIIVGFVGWLWPVKGITLLLEAMIGILKEMPQVFLLIVGRGDEERAIRERAAAAEVERQVLLLGWRSDVHEIMPCFDLLVLPSLNEGMGRVLVEAMAAGVCVIGTRVGGIPDLIKHGENGLLVPPADPIALRNAILCLVNDPSSREEMGRKGAAMCRSFSVETMVSKISQVYEQMEKLAG